jgi:hypothetical protein
MPDVALFQINQKDLHNVQAFLVLRPGISEYPASQLRERLQQALGPNISFGVQVVPTIDRPPSGKHRFTVSSVRPSWGQSKRSPAELQEMETQ